MGSAKAGVIFNKVTATTTRWCYWLQQPITRCCHANTEKAKLVKVTTNCFSVTAASLMCFKNDPAENTSSLKSNHLETELIFLFIQTSVSCLFFVHTNRNHCYRNQCWRLLTIDSVVTSETSLLHTVNH